MRSRLVLLERETARRGEVIEKQQRMLCKMAAELESLREQLARAQEEI